VFLAVIGVLLNVHPYAICKCHWLTMGLQSQFLPFSNGNPKGGREAARA